MPSTKPQILIRTDEEVITKLDVIAGKQNRSRSNLAETIIKEYIKTYEINNGSISTGNISVQNSTVNNSFNIGHNN